MPGSSERRGRWVLFGAAVAVAVLWSGNLLRQRLTASSHAPAEPAAAARPEVATWQRFMREKQVRQVSEHVYVATGYGLATSAMIVGPSGRVIIDTMESTAVGREVREAFDAISSAPIAAVIYTHGHPDHTGGTRAFAGPETPIYARAEHDQLVAEQRTPVSPAYRVRSIRQFGLALPLDSPAHFLRLDMKELEVPLLPTARISAPREAASLGGLELEFVYAPGESVDQMAVWFPAEGVLFAGDNIYPSFPNLYTIRGEPSRDVWRWAEAMDTLAALPAEHLVSGHGPPISGREEVHRALEYYGDAIQYVHDQTVRGINAGETTEEIVAELRLPAHLASHPWLGELYGRVDWSVRAIAASYIGFVGGDAADLHPLPPAARAERMERLAKAQTDLAAAARAALDEGDAQWAVELAGLVLARDPAHAEALTVRAGALRKLAEAETSVNGINYYLTQAAETMGEFTVEDPIRELSPEYIAEIPLVQIFAALRCRLDPVKSATVDAHLAFVFPDAGEQWEILIRRGIAEIGPVEAVTAPVRVTMPAQAFKEMLIGQRFAALTMLTEADVKGGLLAFREAMSLFQ